MYASLISIIYHNPFFSYFVNLGLGFWIQRGSPLESVLKQQLHNLFTVVNLTIFDILKFSRKQLMDLSKRLQGIK